MDYIAQGAFRGFDDFPGGKENICQAVHVEWGDVDAAFASAAHVAEGEFYFPMVYAYAMEPYVAIADYDAKGQLTVYSSAQHPFMVRHDLADVFGLPLNSVRVIVPYRGRRVRQQVLHEDRAAHCGVFVESRARPVKLQLSVEEAFLTTRGDDARVRIRTAVDADGKLVARQATDSPEYRRVRGKQSRWCARKAANRIVGPYRIPNVKIDCLAVYTNTVPASSYRGLGGGAGHVSRRNRRSTSWRTRSGCDPVSSGCRIWRTAANRSIPGCGRSMRMCRATFAKPPKFCGSDGAVRAGAWALGVLLGERCGRASGDAGDGAGVRRRIGIGAERKHGDRPGQPHGAGADRRGRNGSAVRKSAAGRLRYRR